MAQTLQAIFQMHLLETNVLLSLKKACFVESNWESVAVGSGNGLALIRRQAIT